MFLTLSSSFLQTPPHDGRPCLRLTLPATEHVVDFHHLVIAHAGRTNKGAVLPDMADGSHKMKGAFMSTIYQIAAQPISVHDYMSCVDFSEHWFTRTIAEYIYEPEDNLADLACFLKWLQSKGIADTDLQNRCFTLRNEMRTMHFEGHYAEFQKHLKALSSFTEEDFLHRHHKMDLQMTELLRVFEHKFDSYLYPLDENLITFDEFLWSSQPAQTFYVGGIVRYHI